ncbi:MAG: VWA domain-containing protein [Bdellovibrionales bacterium]|nr:VWA domain-containing protein [Bdellovibrionales bacterium]
MSWHSTWAFILIPILLIIVGYKFWRRREGIATLRFSSLKYIRSVSPGLRARLSELPLILKVIALIFVIIALARPQQSDTKIKKNVEGIDIVIALDISDSMLIEDMKPVNRLEASKKTIAEFIKARNSDRIGLVVFSGEAYTRVPLTLDYPLLQSNLAEVKTTRNIKMGTAIGVALANAVGRLKESTARSRIIIFMTDGENNSGTIDPETALEIAKGYGMKIYSIGMGVDGQAQLPVYVTDPRGQTIKTYRPMHSQVNEALLTKFADATGGKFWRATSGQGLDSVFHEIDQLEKTKIAVDKFTKYSEHYQKYLLWGILFYLAGLILGSTWLRRVP